MTTPFPVRVSAAFPTLGEIVHYVSFGSPGGEYLSMCRAAVVAEAGGWVTVASMPADDPGSDGRPARELMQWWHGDAASLVVLNPEGLFFKAANPCMHYAPEVGARAQGGTWHAVSECRP